MSKKTNLKIFFIKGFIPLAALSLFILVIKFFVNTLYSIVLPLSKTITAITGLEPPYSVTFTVCALFIITLILGFIYSTKIGNSLGEKTRNIINKIPGNKIYHIAYDVLTNLIGNNKKNMFDDVAFVKPFSKNNTAIEIALITDVFNLDNETYYSIFTPTGPNPTTGFVRIIHSDNILTCKNMGAHIPIEKAIRYIVSCGYNSGELFSYLNEEQKNNINNFYHK